MEYLCLVSHYVHYDFLSSSASSYGQHSACAHSGWPYPSSLAMWVKGSRTSLGVLVLSPTCLMCDVSVKLSVVNLLFGKIGMTLRFDGCVTASNRRMVYRYSWLEISTLSPYEPCLSLEFMVPLFCIATKWRNAFPTPCPALCISSRLLDDKMLFNKTHFFFYAWSWLSTDFKIHRTNSMRRNMAAIILFLPLGYILLFVSITCHW